MAPCGTLFKWAPSPPYPLFWLGSSGDQPPLPIVLPAVGGGTCRYCLGQSAGQSPSADLQAHEEVGGWRAIAHRNRLHFQVRLRLYQLPELLVVAEVPRIEGRRILQDEAKALRLFQINPSLAPYRSLSLITASRSRRGWPSTPTTSKCSTCPATARN